MPITRSAKKALRASARKATQNIKRKTAYKQAVKDVRKLAASKRWDEAQAKLALAFKTLDKAAKTNAITKNKASRLKSRLTKKFASAKG
jgi:small subunit ribosomal protein S20